MRYDVVLKYVRFCVVASVLGGCATMLPSRLPIGPNVSAHAKRDISGYQIIYRFTGPPEAANPAAGLLSVSGVLYGTTSQGGRNNFGAVYQVTPSGEESLLYSFKGSPDGEYPDGPLIRAGAMLYGTTAHGGAYGYGSVFAISPDGYQRIVYSFEGQDAGAYPYAGLVKYGGKFYGTTESGGNGAGTVFEVDKHGHERVIYAFKLSNDGGYPNAGLVEMGGTFYGTTPKGGSSDAGTVFSVERSGSEHVLHSFGSGEDGANPYDAGLLALHGVLYGTTCGGGTHSQGTVFMIVPSGAERVLYNFGDAKHDGSCPSGTLLNVHGVLYGMTVTGGSDDDGTVYRVTVSGHERVLHSFKGELDGEYPVGSLSLLGEKLYGATSLGGKGFGTLFSITP